MITPNSSTLGHPFLATDNVEETSFVGSLKSRVRAAWRRYCFKRIRQSIRTYDAEKHFLWPAFRPVVGPATMRMAKCEIERNKLPFNPESSRPWLVNAHAKSSLQLAPASESLTEESELSAFPASLRGLRQDPSNFTPQSEDESPIILIT
ncbi:hypothetical protein N8652_02275 [bacterium]|nr:hypothetical protein [bacterium]